MVVPTGADRGTIRHPMARRFALVVGDVALVLGAAFGLLATLEPYARLCKGLLSIPPATGKQLDSLPEP
jgi:hypothetical protein